MYIEPNTNIRLLNNVPLDNSYDHTIYFASASAQTSYFTSKTKYSFDQNSYQRVQRGWARLDRKADDLYDCNYMMFQNTNFGSKWFYAFVKSVEYVNNQCSQVEFEIDVMQTWFFDYSFRKTYVEREHTEDDVIGKYLLPEPVELGDYIYDGAFQTQELSALVPIVCRAYDESLDNPEGLDPPPYIEQFNGVLSGVKFEPLTEETREDLADYFKRMQDATGDKTNSILGIYLAPRKFLDDDGKVPSAVSEETTDSMERPSTIDGYTPRNKKLLTYPYCYLELDDNDGNVADYRYEFFNTPDDFTFTIKATLINDPAVGAYPNGYNVSQSESQYPNKEEGFVLTGFPQMAFTCDTYRAWVASGGRFQNRMSAVSSVGNNGLSVLSSLLGGGSSSTSGDSSIGLGGIVTSIASAGFNATTSVMSAYKTGKVMEGMGNTSKGNQSATLVSCCGWKDIDFHKRAIRQEYSKIIDDFFDMYGYACGRLKAPNTHSRPHWNYVKTKSCTIEGSVPNDDSNLICNIYNKGITFWQNGNEVGNYSLDNTPS